MFLGIISIYIRWIFVFFWPIGKIIIFREIRVVCLPRIDPFLGSNLPREQKCSIDQILLLQLVIFRSRAKRARGSRPVFFFRQPVHFGDYFLPANLYIFPTAFWGKRPKKISRAPRALLWTLFDAKNTLLGASVRRYENQKTFPLVFSSSLFVLARAARRNFHFFPGIFRLKQSQNEDRGVWNLKNLRFF